MASGPLWPLEEAHNFFQPQILPSRRKGDKGLRPRSFTVPQRQRLEHLLEQIKGMSPRSHGAGIPMEILLEFHLEFSLPSFLPKTDAERGPEAAPVW